MKKKLLSLLLAVAIMVTSVSMGFGAIGAVAVSSKDVGVYFSVENKQVTSSSPSTNIKVTVGSNYKVRIRSVTPTVINSSAGTADVSVSYTPNSTVLTNNGIMTVNVSNFSANANTAIRYVITYDILDSSGNAIWTNKTNLAYGVVSQNTAKTGPVGSANTTPSGRLFRYPATDSYNELNEAQAPNKIYVQTDSATFTTKIYARRGATCLQYCGENDTFSGATTSGNAPTTISYPAVPYHHYGYSLTKNQSGTFGPHTWLSWSTPASGYYSWNYEMVYNRGNHNEESIKNETGSVILYYRNGTDKTAATTALEGCANLQKDNYTAASWAALESAMDKAAQVAYAVPGANEGYKIACQTAASVASAVTNAKNGLVFEKANWDAAFNAYVAAFTNDANGKKIIVDNAVEVYTYAAGTTYGTTTVDKYEKTAADAFLAWSDEPMKHYDANDINRYDQHIVDGYTTKLINDYANLPFANAVYTYLDIAIEEYDTINKDDYLDDAWNAYENAVNEAKGLPRDLKTDSQKKINDALKVIIEKKNQLAYNLKPANTTELYIQIGSATAILNEYNHPLGNKLLYTLPDFDKVWEIFEERYNAAIEATDYKKDKQGEVNKAAADLAAVISSLAKYRVLDVSELNRVCGLRPEYNDSSKYVTESYNLWSELRAEGVLFVNKATPKDGYAEKTYENYDEMVRLTAAIQNAYDNLEKVKADFSNLNLAIARIPSDDVLALYEDDYVDAIKDIVATIDYGATFDEQGKVDNITKDLNAAIDELIPAHYKGANYDDVEKAKAEAEAINKQIVTNYSIVTDAINAVDWNKKIVDQAEVDAMAAAIRKAIEDLKYISADYDDVRAAIAEAEAIENKKWYANYYKVEEAIDAVDWNVTIDKQAEVDAMAAAIREAIGNLKFGDADYSEIKKAIADYNAKAPFTDFYPETVAAVDQAIAKVEYGLKANEQDKVNTMKDDIVDAIEAMQLLPADYSRLEATIAYAQKLDSEKYENYSIVTDAINAVDWTLNCRQNAEMNAQIKAINDAMDALKLLSADYDDVRAEIDAARKVYENNKDREHPYTDESIAAVEAVIESINWDYDIEHQADVDAYITQIRIAVAQLTFIRADYNALDIVKAKYDNLQRDLYASLSAVDAYVAKIDWTKTIDKQSEVDTYAAELDAMLENLEYAPADYSAVDNAILIYNSIEEDYYEDYDIAVVKQVIESVERGLKKNEQDRVNQMAQDINNAIAELMTKMKKADLTALNNAVDDAMAKYKEMSETGYGIDRDTLIPLETLLAAASGYNADTTIDKQNDIDVLTEKIIAATENLEYEFTKILDGTGLVIKDGYIYGFEEGSFSDDARELIKFVGAAELKIIETKNGFGTGTIIQFISTKDGSVIETYTVLVFGDANGDAVIDMFDVAYIAEIANEGSQPSDMLLRALDILQDGELDVYDVSMINSIANMDYSLKQDGTMQTY